MATSGYLAIAADSRTLQKPDDNLNGHEPSTRSPISPKGPVRSTLPQGGIRVSRPAWGSRPRRSAPVATAQEGRPDTELAVMTEAELASMRADEGVTVVLRDGRYWCAIFPGFYQPIHLLARMRAVEVKRPTRLCWGYRAALLEEEAHFANGSIPVHLLPDVRQFSERLLRRDRRKDLRNCRQLVEFRRLRDPSLLAEQGYGVFMSAVRRVGYWHPVSEVDYLRRMERRSRDERRLLIGGLIDGRLGGYMESYAVDGILYTDEVIVATEALSTGIGTGLWVETIETVAATPTVTEVCGGLHTPENQGLCSFKDGLGFRVAHVPALSAIPAPIGAYIEARRPAAHYRLTGVRAAPAVNN
jgi:hypothetical protein